MDFNPKDIRVIILAGGFGTRLRPVISDRPKVLAPLGSKVLLDHIINNLLRSGFRDIVLCVGYMKEKIREHIEKQSFPKDVVVGFSEEEIPLGTGGAIKKALNDFSGEMALILNGDTFFPVDYSYFIGKHMEYDAHASICLKQVEDTSRYSLVIIDKKNRITGFKEKAKISESGNISVGVYVFRKDIFNSFDLPEAFSIEKDFFEKHIDKVKIHGFVFSDYFIDIGTPESYKEAQDYFKNG